MARELEIPGGVMFRVELIRSVTGRSKPEEVLTTAGDFRTLGAAIEHGIAQLKTKLGANGFKIVEIEPGIERVAAQRLRALK